MNRQDAKGENDTIGDDLSGIDGGERISGLQFPDESDDCQQIQSSFRTGARARACPKRSPDPDGEVSRRDRRGRRGVLGGGKGTYIGAVFNNCLGQLNRYH
ncbi:MAG: hypothetical protein ACOX52_03490 [Verrucomicrobiota bacterium]